MARSLGWDERLPGLTLVNIKGDAPLLQPAPKRDSGPGSRSVAVRLRIPDSLPGVLILARIVSQTGVILSHEPQAQISMSRCIICQTILRAKLIRD